MKLRPDTSHEMSMQGGPPQKSLDAHPQAKPKQARSALVAQVVGNSWRDFRRLEHLTVAPCSRSFFGVIGKTSTDSEMFSFSDTGLSHEEKHWTAHHEWKNPTPVPHSSLIHVLLSTCGACGLGSRLQVLPQCAREYIGMTRKWHQCRGCPGAPEGFPRRCGDHQWAHSQEKTTPPQSRCRAWSMVWRRTKTSCVR